MSEPFYIVDTRKVFLPYESSYDAASLIQLWTTSKNIIKINLYIF